MTAMINRFLGARRPPKPEHIGIIRRRRNSFGLLPGWRWTCSCVSWAEDKAWDHATALDRFTSHAQRRGS